MYVFAEALAEGAVKMGMPSSLAHRIAAQTVLVSLNIFRSLCLPNTIYLVHDFIQTLSCQGAGRMLRDGGKHPAQLRAEVCTPGGTTIYGLHALEKGGLRAATIGAVEAATERAKELWHN